MVRKFRLLRRAKGGLVSWLVTQGTSMCVESRSGLTRRMGEGEKDEEKKTMTQR